MASEKQKTYNLKLESVHWSRQSVVGVNGCSFLGMLLQVLPENKDTALRFKQTVKSLCGGRKKPAFEHLRPPLTF
jgi:hypothetical protein